jgi:hypothetical protein
MMISTQAAFRTSCTVALFAVASFGLTGCDCGCIGEALGFGGDDAETTEATSSEQDTSELNQEATLDGESLGYEGIDFDVDGDAEFNLATLRDQDLPTNASR